VVSPTRPRVADLGYVFVGGMVGATGRVAFATWFPVVPDRFPWTTFVENVVGAFLLGAILTVLLRRGDTDRRTKLLIGTGVLGSFTTYSTLAVEAEQLLRGDAPLIAVLYGLASIAVGLLAAIVGILLGRRLTPPGPEVRDDGTAR